MGARGEKKAVQTVTVGRAFFICCLVCFYGNTLMQILLSESLLESPTTDVRRLLDGTTAPGPSIQHSVKERSALHPSSMLHHPLIRERLPAVEIPVYVAIPTVPRKGDPDYLLQVLESLLWAEFPPENVYVFFIVGGSGNNHATEHHHHHVWNQAFYTYSKLGMHFLWMQAPEPPTPMHPASLDKTLPLPPGIKRDDQVAFAMKDTIERKLWRSKECHDYRFIGEYMVQVVRRSNNYDNDPDHEPWIIINEDDGKWNAKYQQVFSELLREKDMR